MKAKPYLTLAALFAAVTFSTSYADQRVQRSDLPAAVQRTLDSSTGQSGPIKEITKSTIDGKTVYDVEFEKNNAINPRLRISEDGMVMKNDRLSATANEAANNVGTAARTTAAAADRQMSQARGDLVAVDTESMLKLEELPSAVRRAVEKEAAGREIADIDLETWHGRTVYEVEFRQRGLNAQIHVAEDGTVVKPESTLADRVKKAFAGTQLEDTPAAVQATIKREVGDRRIADIDKERRSGQMVYEVEIDDTQGKSQLHVTEDGRVLKNERVAE
ncbi:MAG TPA: PepSY-like domain-containing protein [Candidatus Synoicihabitans sp.]|nr:PepSY-like domain-containing protein [Candidatus Synoicihabitans sp.]